MNLFIKNATGELISVEIQSNETFGQLSERMLIDHNLQTDFTNLFSTADGDVGLSDVIATALESKRNLIIFIL